MSWAEYWQHPHALLADLEEARLEAASVVDGLTSTLEISSGHRALIFGAGRGLGTPQLTAAGVDVVLCDQSAWFRSAAREHAGAEVPIVSGLEDVGGDFDLVLAHSVLQYLRDGERRRFLEEARTRLRPGGALVLSDLLPASDSTLRSAAHALLKRGSAGLRLRRGWGLVELALGAYGRTAREQPLRRFRDDEIARELSDVGLSAHPLAENLGLDRGRRAWVGRAR